MSATQSGSEAGSVRALAENRRRARRHRINVRAMLSLEADSNQPMTVEITELSVGGVRIRSEQSLEAETVYFLRAFDSLIPPGTKVRIISCQSAEGGGFESGAEVV